MKKEDYLKLPERGYQKGDCLYIENIDEYFHEDDDIFLEHIAGYCVSYGKSIDDIQILFCKEMLLSDYCLYDILENAYCDSLCDDQHFEEVISENKEIYEAYTKLMEAIENPKNKVIISFFPGYKARYKWSKEKLQKLKKLIPKLPEYFYQDEDFNKELKEHIIKAKGEGNERIYF